MIIDKIIKNSKIIFSRKQTNILSAAFVIMITYAVSMILGILRERLLVAKFFACCRTSLDVYYAAFRLPDMVFQLVAIGALSAAFIPVFSRYLEQESKSPRSFSPDKQNKNAYLFSSSVINHLILFFLILGIIVFIFSQPLSQAITGSFSLNQTQLMAKMIRVMLFAQIIFLLSNFFSATLQSHQRFLVPALSPIIYNLGIILSVLLFTPFWGIWAPVIGVVIGAFLHLFIQIPLALRLGFSYSFTFNRKIAGVTEVFRLMLPRTLALAIYQIEATIAVFMATSLPTGSLTMFYLAQRLMDLPVRIFGTPISQAALPALSSQKNQNNLKDFKNTFISSLNQILYLALPAMALVLILRVPLVRIAYGAKSFPWQATVLTAKTVGIFSLAIFSQAAIQLLVRSFYAFCDTKTPFVIGTISVFANVSSAIILTFKFHWGILGLATAASFSSFIHGFLLLIFLAKKIPEIWQKKLLFNWLKMGVATFFTAVFLWLPMHFLDKFILDTSRTTNLVILTTTAGLMGFSVYLLLSEILKVPELKIFISTLRRLGQWQTVLKESEEVLSPDPNSKQTSFAK